MRASSLTVLAMLVQKDKDRDVEPSAEDAKEAPKDSAEAALVQAQAAAAAAAARRLNTSSAAAEHVCVAAMKRAAEFIKVRGRFNCPAGVPDMEACSLGSVQQDLASYLIAGSPLVHNLQGWKY